MERPTPFNCTISSFPSRRRALTGDYNHDGIVDAGDYTVWRDELGETGSGLAADGNDDNLVNAADYTAWVSNFGQTASGSGSGSLATTSVPEPSRPLYASANGSVR